MRRSLVLVTSVVIAAAISVGFFALALRANPPAPAPRPGQAGEVDALIFEACVIFFSVTYLVGQFLYRILGDKANLVEVRTLSEKHLAALHLLGGCGFLGWTLKQVAVARASGADLISGAVGLVLTISGAMTLIRQVRAERPFGLRFSKRSGDCETIASKSD